MRRVVEAVLDRLGRRTVERDWMWLIGSHSTVYYPRVKWRRQPVYLYRSRHGTWKVWVGPLAFYWDRDRFDEAVVA